MASKRGKEVIAANFSKEQNELVRDYRSHMKRSLPRFEGKTGKTDLEYGAHLYQVYQKDAQRRSYHNKSPAKKKQKQDRRKILKLEFTDSEKQKKEHVKAALASLQQAPPNVADAVNSLQQAVVTDLQKVTDKPKYCARHLDMWGHRQLKIVDPPQLDHHHVLERLRDFAKFLNDHYQIWYSHFKTVQANYDPGLPGSVRPIDGHRLEFMLSGNKGYHGFLTLVHFMNRTNDYQQIDAEAFRVDMIGYAHRQMREDERAANLDTMKDEALIISTQGFSAEQNPHLDIQDSRNLQGVMIISDGPGVRATYEYEAANPIVVDLPSFLTEYNDLPSSLISILGTDLESAAKKQVQQLVSSYGKLLSEHIVLVSNQPPLSEDSPLKTGSLLTLPGGVIHAGPSTEGVRAILFLAATNKDTIPYDPDVQYTATNLWASIAEAVWGLLSIPGADSKFEGRDYLLGRIEDSAAVLRNSSATIATGFLRGFVEQVEVAYSTGTGKEKKMRMRKLKNERRALARHPRTS